MQAMTTPSLLDLHFFKNKYPSNFLLTVFNIIFLLVLQTQELK